MKKNDWIQYDSAAYKKNLCRFSSTFLSIWYENTLYPYRWSSIRALEKAANDFFSLWEDFGNQRNHIRNVLFPYPTRRKKKIESFDSKLAPSSFYFLGARGEKAIPISIVRPASKKMIRPPSVVCEGLSFIARGTRREFPTSQSALCISFLKSLQSFFFYLIT